MESNKLLIGVRFIDANGIRIEKEFIVLQDITLQQLIDGIYYGLYKHRGQKLESTCLTICEYCISQVTNEGKYPFLTLTTYNESAYLSKNGNNKVVLTVDNLERKLYEIGFITSTKLVFDQTGKSLSSYRGSSQSIEEQKYQFEINVDNIIPPFNPTTAVNKDNLIIFPKYNISNRQMYQFDATPIEIISPSDPPRESEQNLFFTLLPTVLMVGSTAIARSLVSVGGNATNMIVLAGATAAGTMIMSVINYIRQGKKYQKDLSDWRENYQFYIKKVIEKIKQRKGLDVKKLSELYPDVFDILSKANSDLSVYSVSSHIFSRSFADRDFLSVRLGMSDDVKCMFEIKGAGKDTVFSSTNFQLENDTVRLFIPSDTDYKETKDKSFYLSNLPEYIAEKYKNLENAPLMFSLRNCGTLGIVSEQPAWSVFFIERIIFDLCFHHSPDDLQFIILFNETKDIYQIEKNIEAYKFLPHFRNLFMNRAQFVFDNENANSVFSLLMNIMSERKTIGGESPKNLLPHIVIIVYNEYGLKEHAFAQYLPEAPMDGEAYVNELGLTFIFPKLYKEHLPNYCNYVVNLKNKKDATITPRENDLLCQTFQIDVKYQDINQDINQAKKKTLLDIKENWDMHLYQAYQILSALSFAKISENGKVPSSVGLFELYQNLTKENLMEKIHTFWEGDGESIRKSITSSTISVPLGKTESGIVNLDLHENGDGPHMLIAGTTGSGKSETVLSYLLGLCLYYRPDEVSMMLVDMKGGGFINRIGTLPHVVGSVTDVDGDENGTGEVYMLKRFLNALTSEIRRRKILLNQMYVDNVNDYIKACSDIERHIKNIDNKKKDSNKKEDNDSKQSKTLTDEEKEFIRKLAKEEPLSHLILVVDEFTELKRFSNENNDVDFIGEITTIARVGRSLGFHIILISQNIEGAITDDIRVNSRCRLCLKVATKQASKDMIGTDLAASPTMPGYGRAYLLVGTGSRFEYFQSAYSGAYVSDNIEIPVKIEEASKSGAYSVFYRTEEDNLLYKENREVLEEEGKLEKQLDALVGAIEEYYNENCHKYAKPHIIFQNPLPNKIFLQNNTIYAYQDGKFEEMRKVDSL